MTIKAKKKTAIVEEDEVAGVNDEFVVHSMDLASWSQYEPDPIDANPGFF